MTRQQLEKQVQDLAAHIASVQTYHSRTAAEFDARIAALENRRTGPDFSRLKRFIPSWATVKSALPWVLMLVMFAVTVGPRLWPDGVVPVPGPAGPLHVLVVHEATEGESRLSQNQIDELYGEAFQTYIAAKCAKGPDGKTPDCRIVDKDTSVTNASDVLKTAFARPRPHIPWIFISNGRTAFEGPLPRVGILDLVKKYGG